MPSRKWHDHDAMIHQFDMDYGSDATKLDGWQRLCLDCGVTVGPSITQCKKILKSANINIVDLMNAKRSGVTPMRHPNRRALAHYTRCGKMFPLSLAKQNGFLSVLLVELF